MLTPPLFSILLPEKTAQSCNLVGGNHPLQRKLSIVAGVVFLCTSVTQIAQASTRFLPHKKHMTLQEKVAYFDRSIARDQKAIAWILNYREQNKRKLNKEDSTLPTYENVLQFHKKALPWHIELRRSYQQKLYRTLSPIAAISYVFGVYASQAISVARCESGGTFSVYASNGQYLGFFQMGDYARAKYGHSTIPYYQARAAYAYFKDSGSDWSPWECKP